MKQMGNVQCVVNTQDKVVVIAALGFSHTVICSFFGATAWGLGTQGWAIS